MAAFRTFALLRLEEELRGFTLADVFEELKMEDQAFERWLRSIGLLATLRCSRIAALPQGYTHLTVNHQVNFVDPGSGAHTQNIECHWQKFKNMAKRKYSISNRRYRDYLSEFLWKEMFGKREESLYKFWKQVAELYPVQC
ncbi:hypothetical protein OESDEN_13046 [Oesophagostomum dentatum]|uniref:ISXO2-like transposase domain-containing protein n=1 Tax=Oesophagostomum dentatum TaxID=61180 RepID=A0A0B1SQH7_OESDE|nr:hypothetical protein OESDEN_13046 [Oesophagostomum dentatum]